MGPFDRALLAVYTLTVTLVALAVALVLTGWLGRWVVPSDLYVFLWPGVREPALVALVALALVGMRLFWVSLRPGKPQGGHAVVDENVLGQVRIALPAIEGLVGKVVAEVPGVREVKPRVVADGERIAMRLKLTVTPDVHIPDLAKQVQELVQARVREVTGIGINDVWVSVEGIATTKPRVE
ncbi:MAG: alkaline shock response membrane anchor protein AmaP [Desulfotomaculales bacterium]